MINHIEPQNQNTGQNENNEDSLASEAAQQSDREKQQENTKPLTTQGTPEEIEENLGGTTNLSLDQLKKEGDAGH